MPGGQGSILVIRGGAIGDFILTLPVLAALRNAFPQTRLALLGYPHVAPLAVAGGLVDEFRAIEGRGLALFFSGTRGLDLPPEEVAFFRGFDLIISYLYDPDGIFEANVRRVSQAQYLGGPHRPGQTPGQHATDAFLEPLQKLAIFDADPSPRLTVQPSPVGQASPGGPGKPPPGPAFWLAAHPGSGSETKNWPEARWARLLPELARQTSAGLLLVGGEAEHDRLDRLATLWPAHRLQLARAEPLVRLAARLAGCAAFIGHDSGITHLAAALGLRGLALWGPTDAALWRPRSAGIRIVRHPDGLAQLEEDQVLGGLLDVLSAGHDP